MSSNGPRPRAPLSARPGVRRAFLAVAAVLSLSLVVGAGFSVAGIRYYDAKLNKLPTGPDAVAADGSPCDDRGSCLTHVAPDTPECLKGICTFLIVGSDSRAGFGSGSSLGSASSVTGQRADTIILVREDPRANRTVVLHIPRDLRVKLPNGSMGKINSAYNEGPDGIVQAVEDLTGIQINHYVSVNFQGFISLVNALGGVGICTDRPLVDTVSGLNLPDAGCYNLKGGQALAFVRARHVQGDAIPDFSRIARQQQFMRAVINKMLSPGSTLKIPDLIDAAKDNLVVDEGLNLYDIRDLTDKLAQVGQAGVTFRVVPATPLELDGIDYLQLNEDRALPLFKRIKEGSDLGPLGKQEALTPISPADITVQIYDANSGGKAQEVAEYLGKAGFAVVGIEPAPPEFVRSRIRYAAGFGKQEAVVASYLPLVPPFFEQVRQNVNVDVVVVIAPDFEGIAPAG
jgi:LCP family protein required for cell wall assembly